MLKDFENIDENKFIFIAAYVQVIDNTLIKKTQILFKEFSNFLNLFFLN